ncbi:DNA-binding response regulator [Phyllobacterium salinisoli]|uniref:DNA-binding response regulator n=1 Tax=Phyllobacterium salinisoli TaxID=1899321 RepID=A0A368JYY5_9HYPH|nr:response regulator [Phyllobacterium salinisoli]RCS21372.1 DNA-binding response regulator [Phyllobacterium salinisoli]
MDRALVVEDHDLMRLALIAEVKASVDDCLVIGAQTLEIASEQLSDQVFDLIIIDPGLPGFDPMSRNDRLEVVEKIIASSPKAVHVVVSGSDTLAEAEEFRKIGVAGYVGKTGFTRGVLAGVLHNIATNGFSMRLSKPVMEAPDLHYSGLTPREQEIVDLMACRERGVRRKTIYEEMGARCEISVCTVEKYYKQARAKLLRRGRIPRGF